MEGLKKFLWRIVGLVLLVAILIYIGRDPVGAAEMARWCIDGLGELAGRAITFLTSLDLDSVLGVIRLR